MRWSRSGCGCNTSRKADALVHMGAHGTLEWLPGKAVALTAECFPEIVTGALPVIYPFIVSNPGEAAQAKRRIAGVTIGHLPPPLVAGGPMSGDARELERLLDEYAQADGLDRRRRERLAKLIVETAQRTGLAREAGVGAAVLADEALRRIDAWLCDLKDLAIKDGQHIYGRAPPATRRSGMAGERQRRARGLDRGARRPARRAGPGRLAGARAARRTADRPQYVHRRSAHAADADRDGARPARRRRSGARRICKPMATCRAPWSIDLWGSATLRTGGEEIAQGLALMGCRPIWDHASGRVTGVEVLADRRDGPRRASTSPGAFPDCSAIFSRRRSR